jgi:hypothetical protein
MSRRVHRTAERRLRGVRAPQEAQAEQRTWRAIRTIYAERTAVSRRQPRARLALGPVVAAIAGALLLTPAGATVHRWIDQTLGVRHARVGLFALPTPGRILVAGPAGTWTVAANGSKRRLGPWHEAAWSPHGLFVAVTARDQLAAVNLRGAPQWSIARPDVRSPRWFSPNGYRLAYLSGTTVRVIAGDGTGDRKLAQNAGQVAPTWRPGHNYLLAYADANGTVVARDADTGRVAWSHRPAAPPRLLAWSSNGARLLVLTRAAALVYDGTGHEVKRLPSARADPPLRGAISPDGKQLAMLTGGDITLTDLSRPDATQRRLFTGVGLGQLAWSPDGRWLLVTWPAADQWVFIHAAGQPRIIALSRITEQFSGLGAPHTFPTLDGWCCTAAGNVG